MYNQHTVCPSYSLREGGYLDFCVYIYLIVKVTFLFSVIGSSCFVGVCDSRLRPAAWTQKTR